MEIKVGTQSIATKNTDIFTRTNKVLSAGIDIDL